MLALLGYAHYYLRSSSHTSDQGQVFSVMHTLYMCSWLSIPMYAYDGFTFIMQNVLFPFVIFHTVSMGVFGCKCEHWLYIEWLWAILESCLHRPLICHVLMAHFFLFFVRTYLDFRYRAMSMQMAPSCQAMLAILGTLLLLVSMKQGGAFGQFGMSKIITFCGVFTGILVYRIVCTFVCV
jgi:hypothetical protein